MQFVASRLSYQPRNNRRPSDAADQRALSREPDWVDAVDAASAGGIGAVHGGIGAVRRGTVAGSRGIGNRVLTDSRVAGITRRIWRRETLPNRR